MLEREVNKGMRMRMRIIILALILSVFVLAQTAHSVTLTWADPVGGYPTGTTYNIYRAVGLCSGIPNFVKPALVSGLIAKTYIDTTVNIGSYCYVVTASVNGVESAASLSAGATIQIGTVTINGIAVQ